MKKVPLNRKFGKGMAKNSIHGMITEDTDIAYYNVSEQEAIRTMRHTAGMELERMKQLLR